LRHKLLGQPVAPGLDRIAAVYGQAGLLPRGAGDLAAALDPSFTLD
jgi:hypothetical protein